MPDASLRPSFLITILPGVAAILPQSPLLHLNYLVRAPENTVPDEANSLEEFTNPVRKESTSRYLTATISPTAVTHSL
ncbi:hypothetical protein GCM10027598_58410 [Amycolatopsis oliviviridis]|uniref:Secreted protein n=1 Tax=Amycolatopsis oliviviridis TaxID=1471590 RepID=A0ABQ3LXM6_9PSEU|nr:hypothetical protein GCM10017790_59050 [Amycolatopsis oliviviridis]